MATKKSFFRTPVSERKIIYSTAGKHEEPVLALKINEDGSETFYVKGKTNVFEKIQSFADESNLELILQRCTDLGDFSSLNMRQGDYGDFTDIPKSYIEAHTRLQDMEAKFNELPLETRMKFDNSFSRYLAEAGTEKWMKNMGFIEEETEKPKEQGEKEETEE